MNGRKFIALMTCFIILCSGMIFGCSTRNIKTSKPLLPIIKQYRHITLQGNMPGMKNTGIYLNTGDIYSILATGMIDFCPRGVCAYHNVRPETIIKRIGKTPYYSYLWGLSRGSLIKIFATDSGNLYLGIRDGAMNFYGEPLNPEYYADNVGAFYVDIIVWEREDWIQIVDFFEKMKEKDPENKQIISALDQAKWHKELYLATVQTAEEIEETKKEIQDLKQKAERQNEHDVETGPEKKPVSPVEVNNEEKIAQLEANLAKLMETLDQLEEMKKKLDQEREKTSLLTQELSEKEEREKDLLARVKSSSKSPPVIIIVEPKSDSTVEVNTITFSGVVEDDVGLEKLQIFINDNPLAKTLDRRIAGKKTAKRLEFSERIPLQKGDNNLKIRAVDSDGLSSEGNIIVHYREMRKNVWAVIIGIDNYKNVRQLKYAANDARAIYDHLVHNNHIPQDNVILLINEEGTLTQLRSMLGTYLKNKANKDDMVIIYFAGHGATERDVMSPDGDGLEKYLLPWDADPKDLYASALPMREINHIFRRIRSDRLVYIVDSCYSGATGGRTISVTGTRANISEAFLDRIVGGKGRIILTASGANEVTAEDDNLKHGVFTYFLLEGLRGKADMDKDGIITADEAYRYVSRQVPQATGQEQHPVKKSSVEGDLILGVINR